MLFILPFLRTFHTKKKNSNCSSGSSSLSPSTNIIPILSTRKCRDGNNITARPALSQFLSLAIRRSAEFMQLKNDVGRISMLENCERVGRGMLLPPTSNLRHDYSCLYFPGRTHTISEWVHHSRHQTPDQRNIARIFREKERHLGTDVCFLVLLFLVWMLGNTFSIRVGLYAMEEEEEERPTTKSDSSSLFLLLLCYCSKYQIAS